MYNFISLLSHGLSSLLVTFITLLFLTSFLARDIVFDNSCLFSALNILLYVILPLLVSLPMLLLLLLLIPGEVCHLCQTELSLPLYAKTPSLPSLFDVAPTAKLSYLSEKNL